ncbi:MAG: hypothetical protein NT014_00925 [Candidatus Omnitrophica bacterium]|nr:hypothetical protein [Candidatus Omnitrophota bacterium]
MKKIIMICSIMLLTTGFRILHLASAAPEVSPPVPVATATSAVEATPPTAENKVESKQAQTVTSFDISELKNKVDNLESSLYQRVLDDARISLDSAKQATSLVSVASYIFILISFLLGLFGFREWRSVAKIRKKAERDINLVRHFSLAEMYLRNGISSEAIKEFEEVLKIDPNSLIAHTQLGFLYTDIFKDKAIEHCKKATELDKNNFVAYLNWGVNLDHTPAPKNEVLKIYEIAERVGEEQKLDDISLGKLKRFIAECYDALGKWHPALDKLKEAKARLDRAKATGIPDLVRDADRWLKDLDTKINRLEAIITSK